MENSHVFFKLASRGIYSLFSQSEKNRDKNSSQHIFEKDFFSQASIKCLKKDLGRIIIMETLNGIISKVVFWTTYWK